MSRKAVLCNLISWALWSSFKAVLSKKLSLSLFTSSWLHLRRFPFGLAPEACRPNNPDVQHCNDLLGTVSTATRLPIPVFVTSPSKQWWNKWGRCKCNQHTKRMKGKLSLISFTHDTIQSFHFYHTSLDRDVWLQECICKFHNWNIATIMTPIG